MTVGQVILMSVLLAFMLGAITTAFFFPKKTAPPLSKWRIAKIAICHLRCERCNEALSDDQVVWVDPSGRAVSHVYCSNATAEPGAGERGPR